MNAAKCIALIGWLAWVAPAASQTVQVDGALGEAIWQQMPAAKLVPLEAGVSGSAGGEVRSAVVSGFLYVGVRMPEPSGRFTARSMGRNPAWEEEDRVHVLVSGDLLSSDWILKAGPLGAYVVERKSLDVNKTSFLIASRISEKEWSAEFAVPLYELGTAPASSLNVTVERVRAARPGMPETRFRWPSDAHSARIREEKSPLGAPVLRRPEVGNQDPPLTAGRGAIPAMDARWESAAWRSAAVWRLRRDEPMARLPKYATEVKAIHDGATLAVLVHCTEPDKPVAGVSGDSVQLYLATTGSSYVQYAIDPGGTVRDAAGKTGGQYISRPRGDWNSPVRGVAMVEADGWTARLDIPLREAAAVLGEDGIPESWRMLVMRTRTGRGNERGEVSVLPVIESSTAFCPARYRRLTLLDGAAPAEAKPADADEASSLPDVLTPPRRDMLERHLRERVRRASAAEKAAWDQVHNTEEWAHFRDPRIQALAASLGPFPVRGPLQLRVTREFPGSGYRRQDLVYQSRPGLWVTANLYLPAQPRAPMPALVVVHSHHRPRTQAELQDMGILWARAGAAVLVMDQMGAGERLQNYPWNREAYHSRYVMGMQLSIIGESLMQWMVWDILRGVDLLLERKDVDASRIVLLGAVAGGGDPAGVAAALDKRIAAVAPFNFGEATPESPRFLKEKNRLSEDLADPGWGSWETTRNLRGSISGQFFPWMICASVAPRKFVYSYEMGWKVEDLPAWARYQKVFGFYGAKENLAEAHGFGPFPGPGECTNIGPAQRQTMYPALERWFGIPPPRKEPEDRRPEGELAALTPAVAAALGMRPVYELAREKGREKLSAARAEMGRLTAGKRREWLRLKWGEKLGDIRPATTAEAAQVWSLRWEGSTAEAYTLTVEPGIVVPMVMLRPARAARPPLVMAFAEGGKERFLAHRGSELQKLLRAGIAVCLVDVRGTGETSPDARRHPSSAGISLAATELMLGNTMTGARLKDLRTAIAWARRLETVDGKRIALWGDSFSPANQERPLVKELVNWQIGPDVHRQAEPLGGLLGLLAGLYEDDLHAVAVRGGLTGFSSLMDDAFAYVPSDVIVPGVLEAGDLADIAANLGGVRVLVADGVNARNQVAARGEADLAGWLVKNF
ncbi:MAG TPA: acetylxylan esterase [Bryobacteraceae bacterium]|nr:acetylxylan esterase [Bryobacteraceae bacterium]